MVAPNVITPMQLARFEEAMSLDKAGLPGKAVVILEELLGEAPWSTALRTAIGHVYWTLGRLPDAIAMLQDSVRRAPTNEIASMGLWGVLIDAGRNDDALAEMKRFNVASPGSHLYRSHNPFAEGSGQP